MLGIAVRCAGVMPGWVRIALPLVTVLAVALAAFGTSSLIGVFLIVVGSRIARAAAAGATSAPSVRGAEARA
ncbi:MAG: hypothetical protein M3P39_08235 [Actinomycetota bacterium]|nr:hypothetical protein [Actinomycetota bacterium]